MIRARDAASFSQETTSTDELIEANSATLLQLSEIIGRLSEEEYRRRGVSGVASSIGSHVRHCLEHVQALADGVALGELNYDARQRGTVVETEPEAAQRSIRDLLARLRSVRQHPCQANLQLHVLARREGPSVEGLPTSLGRELAFVLHHTIHHASLIAVILTGLGIPIPDDFGFAPATPLPRQDAPCAR